MRFLLQISVVTLLALTALCHGQTAEVALNAFRAEVIGQRLAVQGFSADPVTRFEWSDVGLVLKTPMLHTLGVLNVESVKLNKDKLSIAGRRYTLVKNDDKLKLAGGAEAQITVDLQGADPIAVLPKLKSELFYPTLGSALDAIPPKYAKLLPASVGRPIPQQNQTPPFSCPQAGAKYLHPTLVHPAEAEFSEEARRSKINGSVSIVFTVNEHGKTTDLWLAAPVGYGLDENAVRAVLAYQFKAGTCNGSPVEAPLKVEVDFQTF